MPVKFIVGDITKIEVEAIVNAADPTLSGSGGVDGAIHSAAGRKLLKFTKKLGGAKVTEAKITPGFNLPVKHIIHAVGPIYKGGNSDEESLLYQTYQNALNVATINKIKSIAFPLISSGAYGFPKYLAIKIAYSAIQDFLEDNDLDVTLVFYDKDILNQQQDTKYQTLLKFINEEFDSRRFSPIRRIVKKEETLFYKKDSIGVMYDRDVSPILDDLDEDFADKLNKIMIKKNLESTDVWKKANIDRKLFSKIFNKGRPSKKTAISIVLALELNLDESLDLLSRAGYTLSKAIKEDLVVIWHIENNHHSVIDVCETLYTLGLKTLF